jgi:hypothetical protein
VEWWDDHAWRVAKDLKRSDCGSLERRHSFGKSEKEHEKHQSVTRLKFKAYTSIEVKGAIATLTTIILPVVLYGCETWSLILREELRLNVFENMVLRRIFELERDELVRGWRKFHNEEFHNLYSSPNIIIIEWSSQGG